MRGTALVGGCCLAGTVALWRAMAGLGAPRRTVRAVYLVWVAAYALVGGEVAWILRPFVGSVYQPVVFLRSDALDGNGGPFLPWSPVSRRPWRSCSSPFCRSAGCSRSAAGMFFLEHLDQAFVVPAVDAKPKPKNDEKTKPAPQPAKRPDAAR